MQRSDTIRLVKAKSFVTITLLVVLPHEIEQRLLYKRHPHNLRNTLLFGIKIKSVFLGQWKTDQNEIPQLNYSITQTSSIR
jgi:hypothetical protein